MKNKIIRPYVNFVELKKNKKVQDALEFLSKMLFPHIGYSYCGRGSSNKAAQNNLQKNLNKLSCKQWNKAIIAGFNLNKKNRALFLGHSNRWDNTPLG
jgi:predicted class III extradiol MEMO1 family dioxygenase